MSLSKTCDLRDGAIFGPQGHNLNKLGRVDDATYIYQGSMLRGFRQEDFLRFPYISLLIILGSHRGII